MLVAGVVDLVVAPSFHSVFSVLAKRLAGKSVSEIAYFVSSESSNLNAQCCWPCGAGLAVVAWNVGGWLMLLAW